MVALEEIGVPFETHLVKRALGEHQSAQYLALNPKGQVPTLVVDGRPLTENVAIQVFLARSFPAARLLPLETLDAEIEALRLMSWFASSIHPAIVRRRFPERTCDVPESFARTRDIAGAQLENAFALIETQLQEDREWLLGDWSIVDAYFLWLWFRATGLGLDADDYAGCRALAQRVMERPSVVRALGRCRDASEWLRANGLDVQPAHAASADTSCEL
jgi:glutathione S-transferase